MFRYIYINNEFSCTCYVRNVQCYRYLIIRYGYFKLICNGMIALMNWFWKWWEELAIMLDTNAEYENVVLEKCR